MIELRRVHFFLRVDFPVTFRLSFDHHIIGEFFMGIPPNNQ